MAVSILRWRGGAAGDLLLYLINQSNIGSIENVKFKGVNGNFGRIELDGSWVDFSNLREIDKLGLGLLSNIDLTKLNAELSVFCKQDSIHWIKSHYFQDLLNISNTIDIIVDPYSLSFVGAANIEKTSTSKSQFNEFVKLIPEDKKKYYATYSVMWDHMYHNNLVADKQILLSDVISGYNRLFDACQNVGIVLDSKKCESIYKTWYSKNTKFLPSDQYVKCLENNDFDVEKNKNLKWQEKYSLMVLSKQKFKFLHTDNS